MRILVRSPNFIGDHIMALPFYLGLRHAYPGASLTLLCTGAVAGLPLPDVFDEIVTLTEADRRFPKGVWRAGRVLRGQFDLGVSLPASLSSAFLLFAAGIPARVGFAEAGSQLFYTSSLGWRGRDSGVHKARLYLELLEFLTGHVEALPPPAAASVPGERLVVIAPGASLPLREWPYFLELIPRLREKYPAHRFVVTGGPGDGKWSGFLRRLGDKGVEDLVGATTLAELEKLCARAALVIANDSGIAHLAATVAGAPTLVLFGPGDPRYVAPRGARVRVARVADLPCSPCEKSHCRAPYGYQRCLRALTAETVLAAASEILG